MGQVLMLRFIFSLYFA